MSLHDGYCKMRIGLTKNRSFDIKRLIGRKYSDKDVQADIKHFPFTIVNKDGQPRVEVEVQGYVFDVFDVFAMEDIC